MQKHTKGLIAVLVIVTLICVYLFTARDNNFWPFTLVSNSTSSSWKTYFNKEFGFEFKYPGKTEFENPEISRVGGPIEFGTEIRIQNYDPNVYFPSRLSSGEYYLQIQVFTKPKKGSCVQSKTSSIDLGGGIIGYKDNEWWDQGEVGGPSLGLCIEEPLAVGMHVTEGDQNLKIAKEILSSFKFSQ